MKEFEVAHEEKEKEHPIPSTSRETPDSTSSSYSFDMVVEGEPTVNESVQSPATIANKGTQLSYRRPTYRSKGILI